MKRRILSYLVFYGFLILFSIVVLFSSSPVYVFAAENYTDVLEDLKKDDSFNLSDYPSKTTDFSVSVISIAESSDGELFVYCYIPFIDKDGLEATSINISFTVDDNLRYSNYPLELLSKNGTLSKYLVKNVKVKTDSVRYYDISAVCRKWYSDIDNGGNYNNTISEISFSVGKRFVAETINNSVQYTCIDTEVVTLKDEFVGYIRCPMGVSFLHKNEEACDSHFVSFNTNYDINRILEADIDFNLQDVQLELNSSTPFYKEVWLGIKSWFGYEPSLSEFDYEANYTYGSKERHFVSLDYKDNAVISSDKNFAKRTYSWDRIQRTETFISNMVSQGCEFTSEELAALRKGRYVFQFYETSYSSTANALNNTASCTYQKVSDVMLLRMKFESEGKVYNLGVVSNKITGSAFGNFSVTSDTLRRVLTIFFGITLIVLFFWLLNRLFRRFK